jgi:two-component system, cell cycle response regulator DivK
MDLQSALDPKDAHVLLVESNVELYVRIARMLAHMGVKHCEWKPPGWDVVDFAAGMPRVDLILMDIEALSRDREVVLNRLRSHVGLQSTRVVAMAFAGGIDFLSKVMALGFDGLFTLPLNRKKFPAQIRQVLSGDPVWDLGSSRRPE